MVDKLDSVPACPPAPWLCCSLDDGSLHSQCGALVPGCTGSTADLVLKESVCVDLSADSLKD